MTAEKLGWPTAEAYKIDPLTDDSVNEKRLKRTQTETNKAFEESIT